MCVVICVRSAFIRLLFWLSNIRLICLSHLFVGTQEASFIKIDS